MTGSTCPTPGGTLVSGLIDFARSSAGPASGSGPGPLMYLPLGRDALSFAYSAPGVAAPVTSLTSAQLNTLFTAGPQVINGVEIVPCSIQSGSGTYQSWNTAVGVTAAQMSAATATCRAAGPTPPGEIQENDGNGLRTRANAFPGKQVIIGFSAANFIAQSNGVVTSQLTLGGVDLGEIVVPAGNLGKPYIGSGSSLSPSSTFYDNTTFGRTVYNVVQGSKITGPGNNDLKLMFARTALGVPQVCSATAQATVNAYGFASLPAGPGAGTCGDTSLTGPLFTGNGTL